MTELESKILEHYCGAAVAIMNGGDGVLASTLIAKSFNITLYKARKAIKALVAAGYLQRDHVGGLSDWDWQVHCYHGYSITEKATKTLEYRKAKYHEAKICAEIWGGGNLYSHYKAIGRTEVTANE